MKTISEILEFMKKATIDLKIKNTKLKRKIELLREQNRILEERSERIKQGLEPYKYRLYNGRYVRILSRKEILKRIK